MSAKEDAQVSKGVVSFHLELSESNRVPRPLNDSCRNLCRSISTKKEDAKSYYEQQHVRFESSVVTRIDTRYPHQ